MAKKGFFGEFKEFISRGNVIDMAVGVVVGSAFTAIVNSLVKDVITPAIGLLTGNIDFSSLQVVLNVDAEGNVTNAINYGNFIQNIISFFIIAFVVFCFVKLINGIRAKAEEKKKAEEEAAKAAEAAAAEEAVAPAPSEEVVLLQEIRDLLKK